MEGKAEGRQALGEQGLAAGIVWRDGGPGDQRLGKGERLAVHDQGRSSSLIPTLARVLASTCLMITAQ